MKEGKPTDRFVVGARPVNRRTTPREPEPPAPRQAARVRKAVARGQLGIPLAESWALARQPRASKPKALPAAAVGLIALGTGLVPLAVLATPWLLKLGLGTAAAAFFGTAGWLRRGRAAGAALTTQSSPLNGLPALEPEVLQRVDELLVVVAEHLPQPALVPLLGVKDTLSRLLPLSTGAGSGFALDDRLYITECLRRYLPDSIEAYLQVPASHREQPLEAGRSATELFIGQLQLLQQELVQREQRAAAAAGDGLMQQQRFLEAKSRK